MSPPLIGALGTVILLIVMLFGMPIGFTMALVGFAGFSYLINLRAGVDLLETIPYRTVAAYPMSLIPMFILMGEIAACAGIITGLYNTAQKWLGHLPGGLAIATVGACAGFAAICGSAVAPAALFSKISLPEMKKSRYDSGLASGIIAAGGTLGILIPPSIAFVIYGILTAQSIGKLFIAGILPGLLLTAVLMLTILILCRLRPDLGPPAAKASWKVKLISLKGIWETAILFILVLGGIYFGVFTPTEGGGIGAAGTIFIALIKRQLNWTKFTAALRSTLESTAMIFILLIGAYVFGALIARSELPLIMAQLAQESNLNPYIILSFIIIFYLIMGCISDIISTTVLTIPIFYPIVVNLGFDPIWFGVIFTLMNQIGMITPPIGLNVFIIQGIAKDIPMYAIFRGLTPFVIAMIIFVVVLVVFPQISLVLPGMMK